MRLFFPLILSIASALPATAEVFRAENRVTVTGVSDGFEITNGGGFGARGMWCAASDYARDVLGARGVDRIYVAKARVPGSSRTPIRFTTNPAGLIPSTPLIVATTLRVPGASLSVDHAYQFCADTRLINR